MNLESFSRLQTTASLICLFICFLLVTDYCNAMTYLDVMPFAISVENAQGFATTLIPKHTVIPTRSSPIFTTTRDNQTEAILKFYIGDNQLAHKNNFLGTIVLEDLPPMRAGELDLHIDCEVIPDYEIKITATVMPIGEPMTWRYRRDNGKILRYRAAAPYNSDTRLLEIISDDAEEDRNQILQNYHDVETLTGRKPDAIELDQIRVENPTDPPRGIIVRNQQQTPHGVMDTGGCCNSWFCWFSGDSLQALPAWCISNIDADIQLRYNSWRTLQLLSGAIKQSETNQCTDAEVTKALIPLSYDLRSGVTYKPSGATYTEYCRRGLCPGAIEESLEWEKKQKQRWL